jgi:inorganic pyrophosphatase
MLDGGEADDKIIAVLDKDPLYVGVNDIAELPPAFVERLHHYFMTYKLVPGEEQHTVSIDGVYGREHAERVIRAAVEDYEHEFGG